MTLTRASTRRLRVMALRIRIERCAAHAFDAAVGAPPTDKQNHDVKTRLLFLAHGKPWEELPGVLDVVHRIRHVYVRTSDVLHGRHGTVDVPSCLLAEWEATVNEAEALGRSLVPVSPSPTGQSSPALTQP